MRSCRLSLASSEAYLLYTPGKYRPSRFSSVVAIRRTINWLLLGTHTPAAKSIGQSP
jgi:hypothetical protein